MDLHDESAQAGTAIFLFLVLCALVAGGIYMLSRLGLVNVQARVNRYLAKTPYVGEFVRTSPMSQQAYQTEKLRELQEKIREKRSELQQERQELSQRKTRLEQQKQRLDQMEESLEQREAALAERRSRFESEQARVKYLADLYSNMPPDASATRLQSIQEDRIVISILRKMETATSSIILSNMDTNRAAQLTRKMANYPGTQ